MLSPRGWSVRPVPVRQVLHLKSAVTALPDGFEAVSRMNPIFYLIDGFRFGALGGVAQALTMLGISLLMSRLLAICSVDDISWYRIFPALAAPTHR